MTSDYVIVTCEHGGNRIPASYRYLFHGHQALLTTHRGYDPGALRLAQALAKTLRASLVTSMISRLLIDLNRSIGHPQLYSVATRGAPTDVRAQIVGEYYQPYRARVERLVRQVVSQGRRVIHVSSHSFTPVLNGKRRNADVGLLYNPSRQGEANLCAHWKSALVARAPELRVRRNYPYAGKGDGLTSYLRDTFPRDAYIGIELEVNQRIVFDAGRRWTALRRVLIDSFRTAHAANQMPSRPTTIGDR